MVTIKRDEKTALVTLSAYDNYFKNNGWEIVGEAKTASPVPDFKEKKKPVKEAVEEPADDAEENWDEVIDELQDDEVEKPLSEMNKTELVAKAKELGIKIPAGVSNKELRELIKNAQ